MKLLIAAIREAGMKNLTMPQFSFGIGDLASALAEAKSDPKDDVVQCRRVRRVQSAISERAASFACIGQRLLHVTVRAGGETHG